MRPHLVFFFLLYTSAAFSQSSIVSAAYQSGGTTFKADWTIGELITENFPGQNVQAAQGINELASVFIITGDIEEESSSVSIYPIPFANHFFIETKGLMTTQDVIELIDISGKKTDVTIESLSDQKKRVSASSLPEGAYLLLIKNSSSPKTYKLIKQ